ncbi:MAG: pyridine nucleotide-disulfide oxidoreductase [Pseudomonas sp.]|uniref:pyridine nucleotide-disulfide oxidoreductase n=1 Tax=Pseudomonas abieticivorans TaxID=2931382 RepID=UPI0020BD9735|nr:pyridine nucleotide-disulfide oxidoreductase [Pseudomonas sp. PIA16]MDE1163965.1 pyridine nucleotide-disulfide oxidoreductase [Pseudomonas sp.]
MYEQRLETTCGCVLGGAGPAGMGMLFNALKTGAIHDLARRGLIIVDASPTPGLGRLGDYQITANSVGDVFLDCLRSPEMAEVFAPLQASAAYWNIRNQAQEAPLLSEVGELLIEASNLVFEHILRLKGVQLWSSTTITEVVSDGDGYQVWVEHENSRLAIHCQSLVLNLGGHQDPQHLLDALAMQGLQLPAPHSIHSADRLLRMSPKALRAYFADTLQAGGKFTVVGGSHSAFSMLENVARALENVGLDEVTLIHRSPIRLFYESAEQAMANGYAFDPVNDVCPVSGRVNRSGGLRYRALAVGREVLERGFVGDTKVRARRFQSDGADPVQHAGASQALAESSVVIQCTGYQAVLPPMRFADGAAITLKKVTGGLDSDPSGCPCDLSGKRLHGLHLFGLGSGLGVDPLLGSEPSFAGRIYGVWQFHHDASRVVIESIIAKLERAEALAAKGQEVSRLLQWQQLMPGQNWSTLNLR